MFFILVLDVDKLLADSLAKVAAYDVDKLFSKVSTISEVLFSTSSFLIKGMGPRILRCPSRGYYAVTFDRGKGSLGYSFFLYVDFHPFYN